MNEYDKNFQSFKDKSKQLPAAIALQEVKLVKPIELSNEPQAQLNVLIPKNLLLKLKVKAVKNDTPLKDLVIQYLKSGVDIIE